MDARESLEHFRTSLAPAVADEMSVDTSVLNRTLYHISPNPKIDVFVPRQIQRTMKGEDETVKRVCTGITILDCVRGYAVTLRDYMDDKANCAGNDSWLGGYTIYALPVEGSIKPSPVLAPIAKWSEERWLVNHRGEDQRYPAKVIGRLFIQDLKVSDNEGDKTIETQYLIHVDTDNIKFAPLFNLKRGYYRMTIPSLERYNDRPLDLTQIEMYPLTEKEYNAVKNRRAGLLSYENVQASCIRW